MGNSNACCSPTKSIDVSLYELIKQSSLGEFQRYLSRLEKGFYGKSHSIAEIDKLSLTHGEIFTNPLGLSLLLGNAPVFEFLLEKGCSITSMEEIFQNSRISPLEYLCRKGLSDVIEIYLTYYFQNFKKRPSMISLLSAEAISMSSTSSQSTSIYPFHIACEHGNINVVDKLTRFTSELACAPPEFDIETKVNGENCALIACKTGNFNLIVHLHFKCMANFHVMNKNNENAVAICIASMNVNGNKRKEFMRVIEYLIEDVGVDILFNHEEILLLAKYKQLVMYLEKKLKELGVDHTKEQIEEKYRIEQNPNLATRDTQCSKVFTDSFKKDLTFTNSSSIGSSFNRKF